MAASSYKFENVEEARAALIADKLGTVYHKAKTVFVMTKHGTGEFSNKDWNQTNSQVKEK